MPDTWKKILKKEIRNARSVCLLGIGNTEKGDDGAGPRTIAKIEESLHPLQAKDILLINAGTMPENFTGVIRKFQPSLTIIIDACANKKKPGTIYLIEPEKIMFDDISSHRLPLSMFVKFLEETIPTKVILIGIEPENLDYGGDISQPVKKAVTNLAAEIIVLIRDLKIFNK